MSEPEEFVPRKTESPFSFMRSLADQQEALRWAGVANREL
jgi:hypothetical protein